MGQEWVTSSLGGYFANATLSKKLREAAQPLCRFRQFAVVKEAFGKGKSATVNFDKVSNVATAGGTLVETNTFSKTSFTVTQGTLTVTEYGNAMAYTGKLDALSQWGVKAPVTRALKNDMVKVLDAAVETQMDACAYRYVGTATGGGVFTSNSAAATTNTSAMNSFHVRNMVDKLMLLNAPPYDGDSYFCIGTVSAIRGVYESLESVWQYTKYPTNGEVGNYYKCRFVRDTYSMDNTLGTGTTGSGITGEAYVFGEDAVMEAIVVPEEIRAEDEDLGRSLTVGWYYLGGFKIIYQSDPDDRIIKWDSA
jgi:N4-gp56 family major capsid protein